MAAYRVLIPVSLAASGVIARSMTPALIIRPSSRRRARQQQVAAARAGQAVDLSRALSRAVYRELTDRMREVAFEERRRLATEVATYTSAGPARVLAAVVVPGQEKSLRLEFTDGWQLTVSGVALAGVRQLLDAARVGMTVTGIEIVEGLAFRLRVRWSVLARSGQTSVKLATLRGPSSTEQMRG